MNRSAATAAREIATALESAGIDYAIGGALALAIAGVPRGTADVDLNVFVSEEQIPDVVEVFHALGIEADTASCQSRCKTQGMFVASWDGMQIDVFLPSIPFSVEAGKTKIYIEDGEGWAGWFLSAEAIAVFKLLFFRGKDVVDLERLVAVRDDLDIGYVRKWIVSMMGEDDERVTKWDFLVAQFR